MRHRAGRVSMDNVAHRNRVVLAVIHHLECSRGEKLSLFRIPEKECPEKKAPELWVRGKRNDYIIEHTRIESFPSQISEERRFRNLFSPLREELSGRLPSPGLYWLTVAPGAHRKIKKREIPGIRRSLSEWITLEAPNIPLKGGISQRLPGVPFDVRLGRYHRPGRDGQLDLSFSVPAELEGRRQARIRKALSDKLPKLIDWKGEGRITVLLLESHDISLANAGLIKDALIPELSQRENDMPDEVYLVETETAPWWVWTIKDGPDLPSLDVDPEFLEVNSEDLVRVIRDPALLEWAVGR